MRALCVSVHDVTPSRLTEVRALVNAVRAVAPVPLTLLVVPDFHRTDGRRATAEYCRELDRHVARGDELALHGWDHLDGGAQCRNPADWIARRVYTAGEGEFAALPYAEARARLERGQGWFTAHGWEAEGFVAPAWLLSEPGLAAVRHCGFLYTTTVGAMIQLQSGVSISSRSACYSSRSAPRRIASLAWNAALYRRLRGNALLRIALHPADAPHPLLLRQAQNAIRMALGDRTPVTKAQFARTALSARRSDPAEGVRTERARDPRIPSPPSRAPSAPSLE